MKRNLFARAFGIVFLLLSFIFAACSHSSATSLKHPPGSCLVGPTGPTLDLQLSSNDFSGLHFVAALPDPNWRAQITNYTIIRYSDGKALPKTARQRLYGMQEQADFNRRICWYKKEHSNQKRNPGHVAGIFLFVYFKNGFYVCAHSAGWRSGPSRRAHNPEVPGSNPGPATKTAERQRIINGAPGKAE